MRRLGALAVLIALGGCSEAPAPATVPPQPPPVTRPTVSPAEAPSTVRTTIRAVSFVPAGGGPPATVTVDVVDTPEGITRGLMFRREMAADHGMLFLLPERRRQSFWMQNTYLPLSIAFIDDGMRVIDIHDMRPLDTGPRYRSSAPCRYALEVNQGWFARHGIAVGDRAVFLSETN